MKVIMLTTFLFYKCLSILWILSDCLDLYILPQNSQISLYPGSSPSVWSLEICLLRLGLLLQALMQSVSGHEYGFILFWQIPICCFSLFFWLNTCFHCGHMMLLSPPWSSTICFFNADSSSCPQSQFTSEHCQSEALRCLTL